MIALPIVLFIYFWLNNFKIREIFKPKILLLLALLPVPIFAFSYQKLLFNLFPLLTLLFLFLIVRFESKVVFVFGLIFILLAGLMVNNGDTIFMRSDIAKAISQHQLDAQFLPFKLRPLFYNGLIYFYFLLGQTANFLSLKNLYDLLLLANFYPLILGIILVAKKSSLIKYFLLGSLAIGFLVMGLPVSPSSISILFILIPVIIYLILSSFEKMNKKIYLGFFLLSLFIQLNNFNP